MYTGIYLLQKEWSINHNGDIWCHNGMLSCAWTTEKRVGHMEHKWGYMGRSGYTGMLQPVELVFENILQSSTIFYNVT